MGLHPWPPALWSEQVPQNWEGQSPLMKVEEATYLLPRGTRESREALLAWFTLQENRAQVRQLSPRSPERSAVEGVRKGKGVPGQVLWAPLVVLCLCCLWIQSQASCLH